MKLAPGEYWVQRWFKAGKVRVVMPSIHRSFMIQRRSAHATLFRLGYEVVRGRFWHKRIVEEAQPAIGPFPPEPERTYWQFGYEAIGRKAV